MKVWAGFSLQEEKSIESYDRSTLNEIVFYEFSRECPQVGLAISRELKKIDIPF